MSSIFIRRFELTFEFHFEGKWVVAPIIPALLWVWAGGRYWSNGRGTWAAHTTGHTSNPYLLELIQIKFSILLTFSAVLIIWNVVSVTVPANSTWFSLFHWIQKRPHTISISRIWLHQVHNVKTVCMILSSVLYLEIVPLCETPSSIIVLKVEIIFIFAAKQS
jgi:hypothetical protein